MICHSSQMNSAIQKCVSPCVSPREGLRTDAALGGDGKCLSRHPNLHQGQMWLVHQEQALRRDFQLVSLQAGSSLVKSFSRRRCGCCWPRVRRAPRKGPRDIPGTQRFRFSSHLGQRFRFQLLSYHFPGVSSSLVRCRWDVSRPHHSPASPGQESREEARKPPAKRKFVRGTLNTRRQCYYSDTRVWGTVRGFREEGELQRPSNRTVPLP